ncbi:MAG: hypothetical protein H8E40_00920 [Chloroflexi bacterium]|nr:hypothetical protein [Chloroflexota bacterium]
MNRPIKVKTYCLLLIISIIVVLCACRPAPAANPPEKPLGQPDRVDVVYFSRGKPCHCIAVVGDQVYATVWLNFQRELSSGKLTFEIVDLDDPKNVSISRKYNASTFSLFINGVRGDHERIIAVPEIWSTPSDAIRELVKRKIEQSLNGEL